MPTRLFLATACFALGTALSAVAQTAPAPTDTLATVNDRPVRRALFDQMLKSRAAANPYDEAAGSAGPDTAPADRQQVLADLLMMELLAQKAVERGLDQDPAFATQRELKTLTVLSQEYVRSVIQNVRVSPDEVKALYEDQVPAFDFQVSQILLPDRPQAQQLLDRIAQGENFAQLARRQSRDIATQKAGGAMGWLMFNQMDPAIAAAVKALPAGTVAPQPVQTAQGWHVLRLDAKRAAPRPGFDEASVWLRPRLVNEKVQAELQRLRQQADVQIFTPR